MYRQAAILQTPPKTNGLLPSSALDDASNSESDSDTIAELERKRRQLDEEIAHFKTQKEKEFREFELDLRRKRKRKRTLANTNGETQQHHLSRTPPTDPSVLSLLGTTRAQANGHAHKQDHELAQKPKAPPSCKPTQSIEKLTIVGTTTPPVTPEAHSDVLVRSLVENITPARIQHEKPSVKPSLPVIQSHTTHESPPTPTSRDRNEAFAGLFTPSYLPLLDSRSSSANSIPQIEVAKAQNHPPQSASSSSSLPSTPSSSIEPPPIAKRSLKTSLASSKSSSLPSALRINSTDSTRKRKHVMFRLSDSSVVEPSSSYEEMSSPDLPEAKAKTENEKEDGSVKGKGRGSGIDAVLANEEVPWSWSKGSTSSAQEKSQGLGMNLGGDGDGEYDAEEEDVMIRGMDLENQDRGIIREGSSSSAAISPLTSTSPSNTTAAGLHFDSTAEDGGSGVGFFELEEELDTVMSPGLSPGLKSPRSDRNRFFDDWGAIPDDDDDDDDDDNKDEDEDEIKREKDKKKDIDDDDVMIDGSRVEIHTNENDLADEMLASGDGGGKTEGLAISMSMAISKSGSQSRQKEDSSRAENASTAFTSGSVPIDIVVRPGGSWGLGSFQQLDQSR